MGKDWAAVAAAINTRLAELDMTQRELSDRSGVAVFTLRQIQNPDSYEPKRRSARTLAAISRALRLPEDRLSRIAEGDGPAEVDATSDHEIVDLRREVAELRERVTRLEARDDNR